MKEQQVTKHSETIRCPQCFKKQKAFVFHTIPFATYIHECKSCGYTIMESDWEVVEPKTKTK